MGPSSMRRWGVMAVLVAIVGAVAATVFTARDPDLPTTGRRESTYTVARRDFVRSIRLISI